MSVVDGRHVHKVGTSTTRLPRDVHVNIDDLTATQLPKLAIPLRRIWCGGFILRLLPCSHTNKRARRWGRKREFHTASNDTSTYKERVREY